jgi:hypothetical protein
MTERDRAWRRYKTRILSMRSSPSSSVVSGAKPHPARDFKEHQPGKLSPVQDMRQNWHLRDDAEDAFVHEPVVSPEIQA